MDVEEGGPSWLHQRTVQSGRLDVLPDVALWHCLSCGAKITEMQFDHHNGTCLSCPPLTTIAPEFWKAISKAAAQGDLEAQATMERYG